jgi:glucose/arabinose dehydrogenase
VEIGLFLVDFGAPQAHQSVFPAMRSACSAGQHRFFRFPCVPGWMAAMWALLLCGASAQTGTYRTEEAFPGLTFNQPLAFATPPGETDRVFVVEKAGRIQVVSGLAATPVKQLFFDLTPRGVLTDSECGLLGLAFHPDFATNRFFYVFYTTNTTTGAGSGRHDRVARFTALAAPASNADILATEVPMITQFDEAGNHNGGDLHFGPDRYLYVALGDEGGSNDQYNNGQRIDKDFFAGLLRIDVDQRADNLQPNAHPAVHAGTYRIPVDNPFVGATTFNGAAVSPANVRDEFWAVGLRNPWRFSFDVPTGRLFVGDVGQAAREEIDLITRGGNYGWSYREGTVAGPRANPPSSAVFVDPIWDADRTVAGSITGGLVYHGSRFPDLDGRYIFGDYVQNRVFAMTLPPSGPMQVQTLLTVSAPAAFGADPRNGDILIASIATGVIRRLVADTTPTPPTPPTPPTTPTPNPTPPSSGGGGGGGAVSGWFLAGLGLLSFLRALNCRRTPG